MNQEYYTYVYIHPQTNIPFYVGKGRNERANNHVHRSENLPFVNRLKKMQREGIKPTIKIVHVNSENEAFELEKFLIQEIGRDDSGPLLNLTDGGEGISGYKWTEEQRAQHSIIQKERANRPEELSKNRDRAIHRYSSQEERNKTSEAVRKGLNTPTAKKNLTEAQARINSDPEKRARKANGSRAAEEIRKKTGCGKVSCIQCKCVIDVRILRLHYKHKHGVL